MSRAAVGSSRFPSPIFNWPTADVASQDPHAGFIILAVGVALLLLSAFVVWGAYPHLIRRILRAATTDGEVESRLKANVRADGAASNKIEKPSTPLTERAAALLSRPDLVASLEAGTADAFAPETNRAAWQSLVFENTLANAGAEGAGPSSVEDECDVVEVDENEQRLHQRRQKLENSFASRTENSSDARTTEKRVRFVNNAAERRGQL
mmetsp:Transcript_9936/g.24592  ORF Transcript_9936/g.24592 Transcript_9936/m.24592 type:complete len:209 (-) Transcript_9936:34-660(-)|eukprot:CAMPEP_0178988550 /NCGR_PEP_ID=MMETSP0795-20121207/3869_1 /TAXON_ID=88552 /ORGANISM="Amoebophrya sp., Strain Ameob2" /LENGTH=208 /DNA_ID=CAMNT_0020679829 /DNA_START=78 /DNA_END=704 /DNA_ORIENTATION=+